MTTPEKQSLNLDSDVYKLSMLYVFPVMKQNINKSSCISYQWRLLSYIKQLCLLYAFTCFPKIFAFSLS